MTITTEEQAALSEDARERFSALWERQPSWEVEAPQPALVDLLGLGLVRGTVLDLGCGSGETALHLAAHGLDVWGVDLVPVAIGLARAKARARGLPAARFLVGDALALDLGLSFDTVIDSGLFHALCDAERPYFLRSLALALRPGGLYHLLGFSDRQPGQDGPRRLAEADLRRTFAEAAGWRLLRLDAARFLTRLHPGGAHAWRATVERLAGDHSS